MAHKPDKSLRGKCEEYSKAAVEADPTLRLVRGWYHDLEWGRQEHWWTERQDGSIYDPTAAQFPTPGITVLYEEYDSEAGFPCYGCGNFVLESEQYNGCCSGDCYGRMVGVW